MDERNQNTLSPDRMIPLQNFEDERGKLHVVNAKLEFPFEIARVFFVHGVPAFTTRGGHAHKTCCQMLIAVRGMWEIRVGEEEGILKSPRFGMLVNPGEHLEYTSIDRGCVLMVVASDPYDPDDYVVKESFAEVAYG